MGTRDGGRGDQGGRAWGPGRAGVGTGEDRAWGPGTARRKDLRQQGMGTGEGDVLGEGGRGCEELKCTAVTRARR